MKKPARFARPPEPEFKKAMQFFQAKAPRSALVVLAVIRYLEQQNRLALDELERLRGPRKPRRWWQVWRVT